MDKNRKKELIEQYKDESKTDYTEDLALLKMIWEEKLAKENKEFYKKRDLSSHR